MLTRDRYWLLTWTTYGTWLPGDKRGFVSVVQDATGRPVIHNIPGTPYDRDNPGRRALARRRMKRPPVWLGPPHAPVLLDQALRHARVREHDIEALAIMSNHLHLVVGVTGDPEPGALLGDYKRYLSRALNSQSAGCGEGSWWTESGSKRKLPSARAVQSAVRYVGRQHNPLLVWLAPHWDSFSDTASPGRQPGMAPD